VRILGKTAEDYPIDEPTIERYLTALGAKVEKSSTDTYAVTLPSWRLDLEREIDLIEEIARLHGYNRFANTLPPFAGSVLETSSAKKERTVRGKLLADGYTEAISSTFCSATDAVTFSRQPDSHVPLGNPLSEEVGCMRPSLVPGMLTMLAHNLNREVDNVRLFEMGTIFTGGRTGDVDSVLESQSLAIGATGSAIAAHATAGGREYSFYDMKGIAEELLGGFVSETIDFDDSSNGNERMPSWLHPGRAVRMVVDGETMGFFGQLNPQELQQRKLRQTVFAGEFDLERLFRHALRDPMARELSRFPAVVRDFSFMFPDSVRWQQIADSIRSLDIAEMRSLQPLEIFRDKKSTSAVKGVADHYSMLLRAVFQAQDRTLRLEELQGWAHRIFAALMELGGQPRFPLELL
jgi:phenylalanyl-tRNA synthetase beta chain